MSRSVDLHAFYGSEKSDRKKPLIGVEIEFEGGNHSIVSERIPDPCGFCSDGSLRDGMEIQTPPSNGDTFREIITDTCQVIRANKGDVSARCGLHVHVGIERDFATIKKLMQASSAFEDVFYCAQPLARLTSRYCSPLNFQWRNLLTKLDHVPDQDIDLFFYASQNKIDADLQKSVHYHPKRYLGFNFHSAFNGHGTLEFRVGAGSVKENEIIPWAEFCQSFVDMVRNKKIGQNFITEVAKTPSIKKKMELMKDTGFFEESTMKEISRRIKLYGKKVLAEKNKMEKSNETLIKERYGKFFDFFNELDALYSFSDRVGLAEQFISRLGKLETKEAKEVANVILRFDLTSPKLDQFRQETSLNLIGEANFPSHFQSATTGQVIRISESLEAQVEMQRTTFNGVVFN